MRILLLGAVLLITATSKSQTWSGDNVNAKKSLTLRGTRIDSVKNDTLNLNGRVKTFLTADAVYKFVNGRTLGGGGGGGSSLRFGLSGEDVTATANRSFNASAFNFSLTDLGAFNLSQNAKASVGTGNGTAHSSPLSVTGAAGGATSANSGTVAGGAAGDINLYTGTGGSITGTPSIGTGGRGGHINLTAGDGGNGTTNGGSGGHVEIQGGNGGNGTNPGSPGYSALKAGNAFPSGNGDGGVIYIVGGIPNGTGKAGNIYMDLSPSNVIRGGKVNIGIGTGGLQPHKLNVSGSGDFTDSVVAHIGIRSPNFTYGNGLLSMNDANAWSKLQYGNSYIVMQDDSVGIQSDNNVRAWLTAQSFTVNPYLVNNDFIVRGENDSNLIYVDASADNIGINNSVPHTSAILDIKSTNRGVKFPTLTGVQQNAILTPATGLIIFNSDSAKLCYYNGTAWRKIDESTGGGGGSPTVGTYTTRIGSSPTNGTEFFQTDIAKDAPDGKYYYLNSKWHYVPLNNESLSTFYNEFHTINSNSAVSDDGLIFWAGNSGTISYTNTTRPGVARFATSTTTNGFSGFYTGGINNPASWINLPNGYSYFKASINIAALSTGSERYAFRIGLANGMLGDFTSGVYLEYDEAQSANWRIKSANFGTRTTTTSATAVATGWQTLELLVNSNATSVEFWVNGTSLGTITTNIPGAGNGIGPAMIMQKSVGTTSAYIDVDYVKSWQRLNTDRN